MLLNILTTILLHRNSNVEIEAEVLRRVEEAKKVLEAQMLEEMEKTTLEVFILL